MGTDERCMKVVGLKRLEDFFRKHVDGQGAAGAWRAEAEAATWKTSHELKQRFPRASLIGDRRVVFNLRGNQYRLDVKVSYKNQEIVILRVGTHSEYDRWEF
jgi:mRNA interferase HigB